MSLPNVKITRLH